MCSWMFRRLMPRSLPPGPSSSRSSALALAIAMSLQLAACALPIEPIESGIAPPARFVAATGQPLPAAAPDPAWWGEFRAPELDRLMASAMDANLDVAASVARLRQADEGLRIAGAQLLPLVTADASIARTRGTASTPGTPATAGRRYGGTLAASYQVDFWGGLAAQRQSARDSVSAAEFDIGTVTLATQSSVAVTLFELLGAQEQLAVQRENLGAAERTLDILRGRLSVGTTTGLDIAQQETVVAQQRAQIPVLRRTMEANAFALATLVGRTPAEVTVTAQRLAAIRVPEIPPGLPSELLGRRPDVRQAEANLAAASANVTAARAALYPSIGLTAEGGLQSIALQTLLRPGATIYGIGASIAQTIFDGGELRAQLAQTQARREELLANYRRAILAALQDAETSLSALQNDRELVTLQAARVDAAQRAYAVADAQLRAGTIDLLTLLNTQSNLFTARVALAQAQTSRLQSAAALFIALGGGWTVDGARQVRTRSAS